MIGKTKTMSSLPKLRNVSLTDRFDLNKKTVLLSGTQALVRATLMQRARDKAAGVDTAGYVTGYRGSPLGAVDETFNRAQQLLEPAQIRFQAGLNEDLAATALWGTQQAELRGEGLHEGVFGLWYGKGPGVDRSGDVFRHANLAGTSPFGGILVAAGDDHTCESSTTCHQSELALIDAMIPILSPAGVQELLDYSLHGWALSRFSGTWVGLKALKDTIEATAVVNGDPFRIKTKLPRTPSGRFLGIRLGDTPLDQEARLHQEKIPAAQAYARENKLDRRMHGASGARVGLMASGKSWLDLVHAIELLKLDDAALQNLGITTYKVGMVWPLEPQSLKEWCDGLNTIIVIEEKRPVLEPQVREFAPIGTTVLGSNDANNLPLFRSILDLDPSSIAVALVQVLEQIGLNTASFRKHAELLRNLASDNTIHDAVERKPWFCAGCPHNSSTRVPEGARAYAGIGCHYMAQWMDRETSGYTQMGGEGANWVGEAHFSKRKHVFQNMGDGTYNHSGNQAIRAAVYADVNITFKILYNDAVAMTGGQKHDGAMSPYQIGAELLAFGVKKVVVVVDEKEPMPTLPSGIDIRRRDQLNSVQQDLQGIEGVTAILYIQTCAAEKRRRRKRGEMAEPDQQILINPNVCEGCGDCGKASNCTAILPLETPYGRKRQIDQSACNKDFSCLKGFCPSFMTLSGAQAKLRAKSTTKLPDLPPPSIAVLDRPWNILITGVGGTGVVTIGALLTMAAHLEGKGSAELQMAGLAQKGGAVTIHCRIAPTSEDISATRLTTGEADCVIAGDILVASHHKALSLMAQGRTQVIANSNTAMTGQFSIDPDFTIPDRDLSKRIAIRVGEKAMSTIRASEVARIHLGDSIYSNVVLLGAAWQAGLIPLSYSALRKAIELNGANVEKNLTAFETGRFVQSGVSIFTDQQNIEEALSEKIDRLCSFLVEYQGVGLKDKFLKLLDQANKAEVEKSVTGLVNSVADGYFKLLTYKDEYEVARLHLKYLDQVLIDNFLSVSNITFHLAPPIFSAKGEDGRPRKRAFGPWVLHLFRLLTLMKRLRGTPFDPFGYMKERRFERRLICDYEFHMRQAIAIVSVDNLEKVIELARLPEMIKGFGHVKAESAERAKQSRVKILKSLKLI